MQQSIRHSATVSENKPANSSTHSNSFNLIPELKTFNSECIKLILNWVSWIAGFVWFDFIFISFQIQSNYCYHNILSLFAGLIKPINSIPQFKIQLNSSGNEFSFILIAGIDELMAWIKQPATNWPQSESE